MRAAPVSGAALFLGGMKLTLTARSIRFLGLILALACLQPATAREIFELNDPKGDDFGAGDIVYPNRDDMGRGSHDLQLFEADTNSKGTWFTTRFGAKIASPRGRQTYVGKEDVQAIARHGFYTINVDVYIDTDRVVGSGRTDTVPGRQVSVQAENAWEKAIIVTPRPQVARAYYAMYLEQEGEKQLQAELGRVTREDRAALSERVEAELNEKFLFPQQIRVRGRNLEFFVPNEFLGGPAEKDWGYSVFVTGSDVEQLGKPFGITPGDFTLMVIPVARGLRYDRFAILNDGDPNQAPVIDLLASSVDEQRRALSDYDTRVQRLAAVPAISPGGRASVEGPLAAPGVRVASIQSPTAPPVSGSGPSLGVTSPSAQPPTTTTATARPSAAAPASPAAPPPPPDTSSEYLIAGPDGSPRRTIPARLKTLNALRADGLITEQEYQELRLKLLSEI